VTADTARALLAAGRRPRGGMVVIATLEGSTATSSAARACSTRWRTPACLARSRPRPSAFWHAGGSLDRAGAGVDRVRAHGRFNQLLNQCPLRFLAVLCAWGPRRIRAPAAAPISSVHTGSGVSTGARRFVAFAANPVRGHGGIRSGDAALGAASCLTGVRRYLFFRNRARSAARHLTPRLDSGCVPAIPGLSSAAHDRSGPCSSRKLFQVLVVGGAVMGGDIGVFHARRSGRRRSPRARVRRGNGFRRRDGKRPRRARTAE